MIVSGCGAILGICLLSDASFRFGSRCSTELIRAWQYRPVSPPARSEDQARPRSFLSHTSHAPVWRRCALPTPIPINGEAPGRGNPTWLGGTAGARTNARPAQDLDFFTRPDGGDVGLARDHSSQQLVNVSGLLTGVQDGGTFCRLLVHGPEDLLGDLALDSASGRLASASIAGPTFAPDELAGRKVIGLFDRAAARDFVDVHALSRRFTKTELRDLAREVDSGFDVRVFIDMLSHLARDSDVDLALGEVDIAALRAFFQHWMTELDLSED
jgi:hypothetical protein